MFRTYICMSLMKRYRKGCLCSHVLFLIQFMGIFHTIRLCCDRKTLKGLNGYLSYSVKLHEAQVTLEFIRNCVKSGRYPKFYAKSLRRHHVQVSSKTLKRMALNEIETLESRLSVLQLNHTQRLCVLNDIPANLRTEFEDYVLKVCESRASKKSKKLECALDSNVPLSTFPVDPSKYVFNFSDVALDETTIEVLSLGTKYCDVYTFDDRIETETQFENLFAQTEGLIASSDESVERLKAELVSICYEYRPSKTNHHSILTRRHRQAYKALRNNKDILITKPHRILCLVS